MSSTQSHDILQLAMALLGLAIGLLSVTRLAEACVSWSLLFSPIIKLWILRKELKSKQLQSEIVEATIRSSIISQILPFMSTAIAKSIRMSALSRSTSRSWLWVEAFGCLKLKDFSFPGDDDRHKKSLDILQQDDRLLQRKRKDWPYVQVHSSHFWIQKLWQARRSLLRSQQKDLPVHWSLENAETSWWRHFCSSRWVWTWNGKQATVYH